MTATPPHDQQNRPILVGVDGSEESLEALSWAVEQARMTSSELVAVTTWDFPTSYGYPIPWPEGVDFANDAERVLDESVVKIAGESAASVARRVVQGHPALVLGDLSKEASLVVVGSRGHGEFAGMLLGSVSEYLATHSHCPVLIIRRDH